MKNLSSRPLFFGVVIDHKNGSYDAETKTFSSPILRGSYRSKTSHIANNEIK